MRSTSSPSLPLPKNELTAPSYDLDWPIECDDEYWEDPSRPFVQPPGAGPSIIQHFTQFIKLCIILGNTHRTIVSPSHLQLALVKCAEYGFGLGQYASKKPKIFMHAKDEDWQRRVIMQLDSELNKWQEALPAHRTSLPLPPIHTNPIPLRLQ